MSPKVEDSKLAASLCRYLVMISGKSKFSDFSRSAARNLIRLSNAQGCEVLKLGSKVNMDVTG